ncbi:MAG: LLM class flavin-dependent oxidoreductase [Acidimicrobiales bacterium]
MRIGVILPTFARRIEPALARAHEAEARGIHGVFCYDHLWPMGAPGKPALAPFPFLGRLSAETTALRLGTLVARVGLVPDHVLVGEFRTLAALSGNRVVAALGTGDRMSAQENLAYGIGFTPPAHRRASLEKVARALVGEGIEVWIGAGAKPTDAIAWTSGATLNAFDAEVATIADHARRGPVSWAGSLPRGATEATALLRALSSAGATWAVVGSNNPIKEIASAAASAGVRLEP